MSEAAWQVEVRVRRNGRLVWVVDDTQTDPERALWFASTDVERTMQALDGSETFADLKAMQP